MSYYLYIHNIYLYQYHDTKPNSINIDWLLGLTPTQTTRKEGQDEDQRDIHTLHTISWGFYGGG